MSGLTYRDAGVDIEAGDALVDRIKPLAAATRIPEVLADVGGFAGLCRMPSGLEEPVLVSGTDGVGTKLKLAFQLGVHDTVGIDLVAMCVNDIVTTGARPLFFLDYFATGALDVDQAEAVVRGIAEGCKQAGCALLGGETAELPGFYARGEYDLAGFAVGVVERARMLGPSKVESGDVLIGCASSGLHSNGFSLARRAVEAASDALEHTPPGWTESVGATLLTPTRIYARVAAALSALEGTHALCHVTGGGITGNLPRVLPEGLDANVRLSAFERPAIFDLIQTAGQIDEEEMRRTFNLGVGLIAAVAPSDAARALEACAAAGERAFILGEVIPSKGPDAGQVHYVS